MPRQEEILRDVHAAFEHKERINLLRYPIHLAYSDGILTSNGEDRAHRGQKALPGAGCYNTWGGWPGSIAYG